MDYWLFVIAERVSKQVKPEQMHDIMSYMCVYDFFLPAFLEAFFASQQSYSDNDIDDECLESGFLGLKSQIRR